MRRFIDSPEKFGAALVALLAFAGLAAFAATNSGGVTSVPIGNQGCTQDIWECSDWSVCKLGFQDRSCSLSYDCAGVDTPKPATRQSCSLPSSCDGANWRCDDWQACSADGTQRRNCRHTDECPDQLSVKPDTARSCPSLQCDQSTLRERITCRLGLSEAGLARENQISYLPELCRSTEDISARTACVAKYKSLEPCWSSSQAEDRLSCARTVLGVSSDVKAEAADCDKLTRKDRGACHEALLTRVNSLVLFRLHDLENRAEEARQYGATDASVADLTVAVEQSGVAFVNATGDEQRKAAIMTEHEAWLNFIKAAEAEHATVEGSH